MHVNFEATETEAIWIAEANEPGPTVAVFGGVHGDEQTGIEVVRDLVNDGIDLEAGKLVLALGNLTAIKRNVRYVGENLNRVFRDLSKEEFDRFDMLSYEKRRAQDLTQWLRAADALLDLHDFTDPEGPVFLITEERGFDVARAIGAPIISSGWSVAEPGGSDYYMEMQEKIGLCYELGCKTKPAENLNRGHGAVQRFLEQMELKEKISQPMFNGDKVRFIHIDEQVLRQEGEFRFAKPKFRTFDSFVEGELIAVNGGTELTAKEGQVIIFPAHIDPKVGDIAYSLGHEYAL